MRFNPFSLILLGCALIVGALLATLFFNVPDQRIMLIVVAGLAFYPIVRYPTVGLYLFFGLSPFIPYFRRLYYLGFQRPTSDPLIIVGDVILAIMLLGLFYTMREGREKDREISGYKITIFIYLAYLALRAFVYNESGMADAMLAFKYYGPPVLCFFIGIIYATQIRHIKAIWMLTVGLGAVVAVYGLKQLYFGYSAAEKIWFSSIKFNSLFINDIARPFSTLQAPAAFADYMQIAVVGVIILFGWQARSSRWYYLLSLPLLIMGTMITSVRSSWIGLAVTFLLWFVVGVVKENRSRLIALVVLFALYMFTSWAGESMGNSFDITKVFSIFSNTMPDQKNLDMLISDRSAAISNPMEEHSFMARVTTWKMILVYTLDPHMAFIGRGLGAFNADSLYFTYLAQFGYPGLIFIIALMLVFIIKAFGLLGSLKDSRALMIAKGVLIMDIIFAVIGITGSHFHAFPGDAYFWFFNGVLIKLPELDRMLCAERDALEGPHENSADA